MRDFRIVGTRISIATLIGFNLLVKLLWLGVNDLAHDEPFTVYWSQQPLADFKAMLVTENNPPLHFLITRWWSALVPFEAAWLRVPSAIFSTLTVWPLFLIARKLGGDRTAWASALFFTLSNYHFGFAHEVRAYALFTLWATWSMWLVVREMGSARIGWSAILSLALVNAMMTWTHYLGWLMVGTQFLCVLLVPGIRAWWRAHLLSALITAVLFAPNAIIFYTRAAHNINDGTWLTPPVPEEVYNMVWRWSNAPVVAVLFIAVMAAGMLRSKFQHLGVRFGAAWSLIPLIGLFLVSQWLPMFLDRYLVFAAPGFTLLVPAAIEALRIPERPCRWAMASAVMVMAVTFHPWKASVYRPTRVAEQVAVWCRDDCHVEVVPNWYWLTYLAAQDLEHLRQDQSALLNSETLEPDSEQATALGTYIMIDASGDGRYEEIRSGLNARYARSEAVSADHLVRVYRFWE